MCFLLQLQFLWFYASSWQNVSVQFRILVLVAPCWMEGSWLPTVLNMFPDVPYWCPIIKDLIMDVLADQVLKGLNHCI